MTTNETFEKAEEFAMTQYEIALEELARATFPDEVRFDRGSYPIFTGRLKTYHPIDVGEPSTFGQRFMGLNGEQIEEIDFRCLTLTTMRELNEALKQGQYTKTDLFKKLARNRTRERDIVVLGNCIGEH